MELHRHRRIQNCSAGNLVGWGCFSRWAKLWLEEGSPKAFRLLSFKGKLQTLAQITRLLKLPMALHLLTQTWSRALAFAVCQRLCVDPTTWVCPC